MKILLVTGSINQGGAEFQLLALARLLQQKGYTVQVLALTDYSYYLPFIRENNIPYSFISNEGSTIQRFVRGVTAIRKAKADLVISYIRAASIVAMMARVTAFFRFKLIISERTSLVLPRYDLFYFNLALLASRITVNSISKYNYIRRKFFLVKNRTVYIPNIIETKKYSLAGKKEYHSRSFVLGCVGRVSPEKNLLNLVRAVELLLGKGYDLDLNIIGQTNHPSCLEQLQALIAASQYAKRFHLKGAVSDMPAVYAGMDLLCHMSFYEGFPNVIAEAISSGVPVVASNIEEISFIIKDGENGFLADPYSTESIAKGIEKFLLLSPEQKTSFSENSKKKAALLFDNDSVYNQYAVMFDDLKFRRR